MTELPHWTVLDATRPPGVRELADGGRVVAIVATSAARAEGWAAGHAVEAARGWSASGIRLILADGSLTNPALHVAIGIENEEGVADALVFGASVRRVARRVEGQGYFAVTAGTVVADAAEAMSGGRWGRLCSGFRDAGVTFAVYVDADDPCASVALDEASHVLVLAGPEEDVPSVVTQSGASVIGVVGPAATLGAGGGNDAPSADDDPVGDDAPAGDDDPVADDDPVGPARENPSGSSEELDDGLALAGPREEGSSSSSPAGGSDDSDASDHAAAPSPAAGPDEVPSPAGEAEAAASGGIAALGEVRESAPDAARPGSRKGLIWLVIVLVILAALVAGWFGLIRIPGITPRGGAGEALSWAEGAPPAPSVARAPAEETSPAQGFSVVVGSSPDATAARAVADSLSTVMPDVLFTFAPAEVDGRSIYRTLAGPAVDSSEAAELLERFAVSVAGPFPELELRSTPRAFELGEMPDLDAAERRVAVLRGLDVPAYVFAVDYADGSIRYRVYAGAYADEAEAALLLLHLTDRGLNAAHLSDRKGRLPA